jgi:hypothetical protein
MEQNPYRAEADRLRAIADKLHQPSAQDEAMRNAFPLGAGFGHGSQRSRDRRIEARINRATKAVAAEAKAAAAERMADARDRGEPTEAEKAAKRREVVRAAIKQAAKQERAERKAMPDEERLFMGDLGGGIFYCDRSVERNGDYKRLAFLPRRGHLYGPLEWDAKRVSPFLRERIEEHAAARIVEGQAKATEEARLLEQERQWRKSNPDAQPGDIFGTLGRIFQP